MRKRLTTVAAIAALLTVLLCAQVFAYYNTNVDLKNTNPLPAKGLIIKFKVEGDYQAYFNGYADRYFDPATKPDGKTIKWLGVHDANNQIDQNEVIHVGWLVNAQNAEIAEMYWTDGTGAKLTNGDVLRVVPKWLFSIATRELSVKFVNALPQAITVSNVKYAVVDYPGYALQDLNLQNAALNASLVNLPGGASFSVPTNGSQTLPIPGTPLAPGKIAVIRYEIAAAGSGVITDFSQSGAFLTGIPTLSEWALIVFSVLLLAMMTYYVIRRRRLAHSTAA